MQVSRQAVYSRCRSVDNALASNTDSAQLRLGLSQDEVYKIMKGCRCAAKVGESSTRFPLRFTSAALTAVPPMSTPTATV